MLGTVIDDGDLIPLVELPRLRRVKLDWYAGGNVEKLRQARPDLVVDYFPPLVSSAAPNEKVGSVTINPPGDGIEHWSIFDNLAETLGAKTNYAAEEKLRRVINKADPDLLRQIEFDTEGGGVGIYAKTEAAIRAVAAIVQELVEKDSS